MSVHKDKKTGKWYVSCRYDNWDGARKQKMKRGFETKREALVWDMNLANSQLKAQLRDYNKIKAYLGKDKLRTLLFNIASLKRKNIQNDLEKD